MELEYDVAKTGGREAVVEKAPRTLGEPLEHVYLVPRSSRMGQSAPQNTSLEPQARLPTRIDNGLLGVSFSPERGIPTRIRPGWAGSAHESESS